MDKQKATKYFSIYQHITLNDHSVTPKYHQLANCIIKAVQSGKAKIDEVLPSLNELSFELEISRDTAQRGYKYLKEIGILGSIPGKGYFIKEKNSDQQPKVFLLFNKLSTHKKIIYDSIVSTLNKKAAIDFFIYDNDFSFFKKLLKDREGYTHFVIIPHFIEGGNNLLEVIDSIDKSKLILLDKTIPGISGQYSAIYENFEKDIFNALEQALPRLEKYHTLKIIFPQNSYYPQEILEGFTNFCDQYAFNSCIVRDLRKEKIQPGEVFINLMEDDLVKLLEEIVSSNLKIGEDVGVISYNETPLKKLILNGITTVSTDFHFMGQKTAELILSNAKEHFEVPFSLTLRASL